MNEHNLVLYYKPTCPFCQKVLSFMEEKKIDIPKKDIVKDENIHQELMKIGGKQQVPCLMIDGKPLYESDEIIRWLGENLERRDG